MPSPLDPSERVRLRSWIEKCVLVDHTVGPNESRVKLVWKRDASDIELGFCFKNDTFDDIAGRAVEARFHSFSDYLSSLVSE